MRRRRLIIIGGVVAAVAAAAFGIYRWSASAQAEEEELQTAAVERGTVTASIDAGGTLAAPQVEALSWGASGIVGSVLVTVGDTVRAGDVLMELDAASLDAASLQAQADLAQAEEALADVLDGPSASELAAAALRVANAQDALEEAQRTWTSQQEGNRASGDTIAGAHAKLVLAEAAVGRAQDEYGRVSGLSEDDPRRAQALLQLVAARQSRDSAARSLSWYTGHPTETQQAQLDAQVATAEAELEEAQEALADLRDGPNDAEIVSARAHLASAQASFNNTRIVAPFDGTVASVASEVGDVVRPNTAAATVADLSHLQVSLDVSELEIGQIEPGQEASITIDALPDVIVEGFVGRVSLVGTNNQGVVTYPVTITIHDPDPTLQPGMTAAVSIIVAKQENVLLVPNRAVQVSGGQNTVVVLYQGQQIPVAVTLGLEGESYSEIAEGTLREGDEVVLNATATSTRSTTFIGPAIGGIFIDEGGEMPPGGGLGP